MTRFLVVFAAGAVLAAAAQACLSLGAHPDNLASMGIVCCACLGIVAGAAAMAAGMVGMGDGYVGAARRLYALLGTKHVQAPDELPVGTPAGLASSNDAFWKAYRGAAAAVCLSLGGSFVLSVSLSGLGYLTYFVGVGAGVATLAVWGGVILVRSLCRVHVTCQGVEETGRVLEQHADLPPPVAWRPARTRTEWVVRRPSVRRYRHSLEMREPRRH